MDEGKMAYHIYVLDAEGVLSAEFSSKVEPAAWGSLDRLQPTVLYPQLLSNGVIQHVVLNPVDRVILRSLLASVMVVMGTMWDLPLPPGTKEHKAAVDALNDVPKNVVAFRGRGHAENN